MEKKTYQQLKDQAAEELEFENWEHARTCFARARATKKMDDMYKRVADLYADQEKKAYAREAVKADRDRIMQECTFKAEGSYICIDEMSLSLLPIELP